MILKKEEWTKSDIEKFQKYLETFKSNDEKKINWTKNLLNTKLPVLAIKSQGMKDIAKEIYKGNYLSFLDLMIWEYYENTIINGILICKIKDFDDIKKYLDIYSEKADNWATCDVLKLKIKNNEKKYFNLILEYIKSPITFKRRIGVKILFEFIDNNEYIDFVFDISEQLKDEEEYYVNMINAWLICECFIKQRKNTLKYLDRNNLNKFTINKAISKCRDSFRVTPEDKNMLLKYKK